MKLLVLLPPSEAKCSGGEGLFDWEHGNFGALAAKRCEVASTLWHNIAQLSNEAHLSQAKIAAQSAREVPSLPGRVGPGLVAVAGISQVEKMLGARGALADRALGALSDLFYGNAVSLPAWKRYCGVVWQHLAPAELEPEQLERLLIPSALMGITGGLDPVPDYKLKMSVALQRGVPLNRWWRPTLTQALLKHASKATMVDLLPAEHAKAVDWELLSKSSTVVRVTFESIGAGGVKRAVGHEAKAVKGVFARHLLLHGLDAVNSFSWKGWLAHGEHEGLICVSQSGHST